MRVVAGQSRNETGGMSLEGLSVIRDGGRGWTALVKIIGDPHEIATHRWGAGSPPLIEHTGVSGSISGDASPFASESQAFFEKRERRLPCRERGCLR